MAKFTLIGGEVVHVRMVRDTEDDMALVISTTKKGSRNIKHAVAFIGRDGEFHRYFDHGGQFPDGITRDSSQRIKVSG